MAGVGVDFDQSLEVYPKCELIIYTHWWIFTNRRSGRKHAIHHADHICIHTHLPLDFGRAQAQSALPIHASLQNPHPELDSGRHGNRHRLGTGLHFCLHFPLQPGPATVVPGAHWTLHGSNPRP